MISSRTHAAIDYGVAATLAALALSPALGRRARATLGAAAAYHTSYSVLTDYEGGVAPRISMERHLALDLAGAGSIVLSGLLGPVEDRTLLLAVGAAELAVVALSERHAQHGPPEMAYEPLDVPKPAADGLWIVDSVIGPGAPVRMTVLRLGNGDLLLHSPTRYEPGLHRSLERLGRIRHLLAPNIVHWTFIKPWQDALPEAQVWAAPGLRDRGQVRRSGLRIDHELADRPPMEWADEIDQAVVRGGAGFAEVAMFHRPSRTLLLTDLVQNLEAAKLPWLLRAAGWMLGSLGPVGRAPAHLRAVVGMRRAAAAAAARRVLAWEPDRVLMTHGRPFEPDGAAKLRRSLAWLVG